jgi:hypothetical protein
MSCLACAHLWGYTAVHLPAGGACAFGHTGNDQQWWLRATGTENTS